MPVDPRVVELLLRYEELRDAGRPPTPEELCAGSPELLDQVRRCLGRMAALDGFIGDTRVGHGPAAEPGISAPPNGGRISDWPLPSEQRQFGTEVVVEKLAGVGETGVVHQQANLQVIRGLLDRGQEVCS
jgi:hypothetical protein